MQIDEVFLRRGLIDQDQLQQAREQSGKERLHRVIAELGLANEDEILAALADEFGMRVVDLHDASIDPSLLAEFPTAAVFRHALLPIERSNGHVIVATNDPFDFDAIEEFKALSRGPIEVVLGRASDIDRLIKESLGVGGDTIHELVVQRGEETAGESWQDDLHHDLHDTNELAEMAQAASVVRLVNELLTEALDHSASDIHVEPQQQGLMIRFRIDGMLWVQPVPAEIHQFFAAIVTRLKIMARLNIAEKRLPQDGRIKLRLRGRDIDVRVSIIPTLFGEGVVLRLLDQSRMVFDLNNIGMPDEIATMFRKLIAKPHGIVLVTGPTGHGKTTTLYSTLNEIKKPSLKIVTIEDPVEYHSDGIAQIQVQPKIGLTFASGLRSILRHDPDVILVGEIRDRETAEIAIQSALTGHMVFSTLHSNDAASSFTRLVDMGVEPYLVASTVVGVMAQRLVRVLCPECKADYEPSADELPDDFPASQGLRLWKPVGCRSCRQTGFSGRTGIYELLPTDANMQRLCHDQASVASIRQFIKEQGLTTLRKCGWQKVVLGETGMDEILRVTEDDLL